MASRHWRRIAAALLILVLLLTGLADAARAAPVAGTPAGSTPVAGTPVATPFIPADPLGIGLGGSRTAFEARFGGPRDAYVADRFEQGTRYDLPGFTWVYVYWHRGYSAHITLYSSIGWSFDEARTIATSFVPADAAFDPWQQAIAGTSPVQRGHSPALARRFALATYQRYGVGGLQGDLRVLYIWDGSGPVHTIDIAIGTVAKAPVFGPAGNTNAVPTKSTTRDDNGRSIGGSAAMVQIVLALLVLAALVAGLIWNRMRSEGGQERVPMPEDFAPPTSRDDLFASRVERLESQVARLDQAVQSLDWRMAILQGVETAPTPSPIIPTAPPVAPAAPPAVAHAPEPVATQAPTIEVEVPPMAEELPPVKEEVLEAPAPAPIVPEGHPLPPRWGPSATLPSARLPRIASAEDLESLASGRGLAWLGGLALLIGALFFLSLAFSRGWIGPAARVTIGLIASVLLMGLGAWLIRRRDILLGQVLVAVGIGVSNLSLLAATRLYHLVPLEISLLGVLAGAVVAAVIAIRTDSQIMAGYGIVTALVAPPLFGAAPDGPTVAFLATALVGTTIVALYRSWRWLPPLAFVLTAPQAADWFFDVARHDKPVGLALGTLAGFWLLYIVASGGEVFRTRDASFRSVSVTLLLANAAFTVASGFLLLSDSLAPWRGLFLLVVALAHGAVGGYFLVREGDTHPFGLLAAGTGVAALTMAVPVQLGGPPVPLAWAGEAVALAWVATVRRHRYSAAVALIAGLLAITHFLAFEYPLGDLRPGLLERHGVPFVNAAGGTLAYLLVALAATGFIVRERSIRVALGVTGVLLATYAVPFELGGIWMLAAWCALTVLTVAGQRVGAALARRAAGAIDIAARDWTRTGFFVPAAIGATAATGRLLATELPVRDLMNHAMPGVPFTDRGAVAAAIVIGTAALSAWLTRDRVTRQIALVAGFAVPAWLLPFELDGLRLLAGWSALAVLAVAGQRAAELLAGRAGDDVVARWTGWRNEAFFIPAAFIGAVAVLRLIAAELPPRDLVDRALPDVPFTDRSTAAAAIVIGAAGLAAWLTRHGLARQIATVTGLAVMAYLLPFELGGGALVFAWSVLGVASLVLDRRAPAPPRLYLGTAAVIMSAALVQTVRVAPVSRLAVDATTRLDGPPFLNSAAIALASLTGVALIYARLHQADKWGLRLAGIAGALAVYLLSIDVVDVFQRRAGGEVSLESLQRGAQVALSILWAVLGGFAIAVGIVRATQPLRLAGLVLLGLATAKVFILDLAFLNTTYRVLSFIGLGILLLLSSHIYRHLRGRVQPHDSEERPPAGAI